uniref:Putative secreted protein n=1 Tax=Ixodes ricinus TaxID=34613 RepID=A0A6B0UM85_IXORI
MTWPQHNSCLCSACSACFVSAWLSVFDWTARPCSDLPELFYPFGERKGRVGSARAALQCPAVHESLSSPRGGQRKGQCHHRWGCGLGELANTFPGDQDTGNSPPAAMFRLQFLRTGH